MCVRTRRHKLAAAHGRGEGELYELEIDPKETKNLWGDPQYRRVRLEMYERLVDRMAWTVDPLPERQAEWWGRGGGWVGSRAGRELVLLRRRRPVGG